MFLIDWQTVATDAALDRLRTLAGTGNEPSNETLRPIVAATLAHAGGLPVSDTEWSAADCTSACTRLLHEATGAALRRRYAATRALPGCDLGPGGAGLDRLLAGQERIAVNRASEHELLPLPVLGPVTAARTIESRRHGGRFGAPADIAARVTGVNASGAERLSLMLDFSEHAVAKPYTGDFDADFGNLLQRQSSDSAADRLLDTVEMLAAMTAGDPHPYTRLGRRRTDLPQPSAKLPAGVKADSVEILEDESYLPRMQALLTKASDRIDVAMFFMSLIGDKHPNRKLLALLADAHGAGRAVRVLLDRDSEDDPYGSRTINAPAIAFLKDQGVPVRTDTTDNLLHSKFVVIDGKLSVIGSHNWTSGSYFRYHDTSLAIGSADFAQGLKVRFDTLWDAGVEP
ncbi:MAG: phospholipase D-like domain-containing protein [Pseudomonadota bacterium]